MEEAGDSLIIAIIETSKSMGPVLHFFFMLMCRKSYKLFPSSTILEHRRRREDSAVVVLPSVVGGEVAEIKGEEEVVRSSA